MKFYEDPTGEYDVTFETWTTADGERGIAIRTPPEYQMRWEVNEAVMGLLRLFRLMINLPCARHL